MTPVRMAGPIPAWPLPVVYGTGLATARMELLREGRLQLWLPGPRALQLAGVDRAARSPAIATWSAIATDRPL